MAVVNHPFYGNRDAGEALAWDKTWPSRCSSTPSRCGTACG
jgi:hypothetical protein